MQDATTLWEAALEAFPYPNLEMTGYCDGDLESPEKDEQIYSEEFTFDAGQLIDERLVGGGWIEMYRDDKGEISISALFDVARNGDWKDGRIFPECVGIQAHYDIPTGTWEMHIDRY